MKNFTQKEGVERKGKRHKGFAILCKVYNKSTTSLQHMQRGPCMKDQGQACKEENGRTRWGPKARTPQSSAQKPEPLTKAPSSGQKPELPQRSPASAHEA